jgi:hypothetical protein
MRLRSVLAAIAMLVAATPAAGAAPVTREQALRVAKRAASRKAAGMGLRLPPSEWTAACYRAGHGHWHCEAGAGQGYCSASVRVSGVRKHPIARDVRMYCLE